MKGIQVSRYGGPEVLEYREVPDPEPGAGELLVKLEAIGVNFIDVYHRTGLYPIQVPFIPGTEGAGVVEATGADVEAFRPGVRVGYTMSLGSYAEKVVVPQQKLLKLPEEISSKQAAAILLQGMTVHYLCRSTYAIKSGDFVLIHAAAGGVGLMLVQVAKHLGAFVIGTVSTAEKAKISKDAGADEIILYMEKDFLDETKRITGGKGVAVVYDSVGKTTFEKSLDCLQPRGLLVSFGQSSGPIGPFNPAILASKGSLFLTRPTVAHYVANRDELNWRSQEVFEWIRQGIVKIRIDSTYPLANAAEAHRRLESRASKGKILLLPN